MLRSIHTALSTGGPPDRPTSAAAAAAAEEKALFRELFTKHECLL